MIRFATIAQYHITYEVVSPVVKEKELKKKEGNKEVTIKEKYTDYVTTEKQALLNIPFKEYKDGTYKINSYPYFSNDTILTREKLVEEPLDKSAYAIVTNQQQKDCQAFVQNFLEKYVTTSTEEMTLLLKQRDTTYYGKNDTLLRRNRRVKQAKKIKQSLHPFFSSKISLALALLTLIFIKGTVVYADANAKEPKKPAITF
ncbi:conjugal transfer protein [Liquorilactobacillus ghanensis]|uniref:conjugal transfer protein n=1 Tax=Liquorilactobacillus ghanensis TaxID=399370 RepID=UPI0039E80481